MIRIGSDTDIGMNRNSPDWLGMNSYPILSPGLLIVPSSLLSELDIHLRNSLDSFDSGSILKVYICTLKSKVKTFGHRKVLNTFSYPEYIWCKMEFFIFDNVFLQLKRTLRVHSKMICSKFLYLPEIKNVVPNIFSYFLWIFRNRQKI